MSPHLRRDRGMTVSSPSFSRSPATVSAMNVSRTPFSAASADIHHEIARQRHVPCVEWYTSGWNCIPHVRSPFTRKAAQRTCSVLPMMRNDSGASVMVSPCDIHTRARWREGAHKRVLGVGHLKHGAAIFACGSRLHRPSGEPGEVLGAVADSQQRQFSAERVERGHGASGSVTEYGLPEEESRRACRRRSPGYVVERMDLAIHIELTYAACDQLGVCDPENRLSGIFAWSVSFRVNSWVPLW